MKKRILIGCLSVAIIVSGYYVMRLKKPVKLEKVVFAEPGQPAAGLLYIADVEGFFEDEGLAMQFEHHTSGKAALNSVLEGKADLGISAETPIVQSVLNGEEFYLFARVFTADNTEALLARKDHGISKPQDLKGKKIGVTLGTSGEFSMDQLLLVNNIGRDEIQAINTKPEDMLSLITSGKVDAGLTWQPHLNEIQKKLGANALTICGGELVYTFKFNAVAKKDFVHKNPGIIEKTLRALVKAEDFAKKNPQATNEIIANTLHLDESSLKEYLDVNTLEITLNQPIILALEQQTKWVIKKNLTDATEVPNYLDYIYMDALEKVKPEAATIIH